MVHAKYIYFLVYVRTWYTKICINLVNLAIQVHRQDKKNQENVRHTWVVVGWCIPCIFRVVGKRVPHVIRTVATYILESQILVVTRVPVHHTWRDACCTLFQCFNRFYVCCTLRTSVDQKRGKITRFCDKKVIKCRYIPDTSVCTRTARRMA